GSAITLACSAARPGQARPITGVSTAADANPARNLFHKQPDRAIQPVRCPGALAVWPYEPACCTLLQRLWRTSTTSPYRAQI
ncbi:MAG TPA: hypothetical protein VJQ26_09940, partial [Ktedonobacteraceae bacterium]|nr:hypothetical protein [Ktedonobacteraceae bacterium]